MAQLADKSYSLKDTTNGGNAATADASTSPSGIRRLFFTYTQNGVTHQVELVWDKTAHLQGAYVDSNTPTKRFWFVDNGDGSFTYGYETLSGGNWQTQSSGTGSF